MDTSRVAYYLDVDGSRTFTDQAEAEATALAGIESGAWDGPVTVRSYSESYNAQLRIWQTTHTWTAYAVDIARIADDDNLDGCATCGATGVSLRAATMCCDSCAIAA